MKIYIEILDSEYIKIYELSTQIKSKIKTFKDSLNKDLVSENQDAHVINAKESEV